MGQDEEIAHHPLWAPDGNRLFYFSTTFPMAVDVRTQPTVGFGRPVPLAGLPANMGPDTLLNHDIAPDGSRFVAVFPGGAGRRWRGARSDRHRPELVRGAAAAGADELTGPSQKHLIHNLAAGGRGRGRPVRAAGATLVTGALGAEHEWGCPRSGPGWRLAVAPESSFADCPSLDKSFHNDFILYFINQEIWQFYSYITR